MQNINFYFILLIFYATLALIFISFNMVHPKKYINYISISHVFGIMTVVCTLFTKIINPNQVMLSFAVLFFLCSHFSAYYAIAKYLKIRISKYVFYIGIVFVIIDIIALNFVRPLSIWDHKILLMFLYIYFGVKILKNKHKSFSKFLLGVGNILFPLIQICFGLIWLFVLRQDFYIDIVAYMLHTLTLSLSIILILVEETKKQFKKDITLLEEKVESNEKLLQDAYELDKLKTEFIANISHELRTPINIIFSSIQLLEINHSKNTRNEKCGEYLKVMKQNSYRLIKLVNNLIDMSKIEAGFLELNLHNYNIIEVVENITLSMVPYAEQKGIQVEFDTEFEEKVIACDSEKMERIILNLLSNAVKFTENGGKVEVNIHEKEDNIFIDVKDNGRGISKNMHKSIFNRFTQLSDIFVRDNEGSGIGLSLVKSFVEMQGGKIELQSEINKGTKFTIILPLKRIENDNMDNVFFSGTSMKNVEIEFSDV
ncbi:sensor histidine kinase [Haloimpatiens sp. FM7330]|uniref:sensor histidine kinase n=1 Tax=Haloimpatiens sp. FM7330 TaxID=3298610 RepID=UPI0036308806